MAGHVERFAPSPTGPLHLGHAYSACLAHDAARAAGGRFLLRLEDIDRSRSRPEWAGLIETDLRWLGLSWNGPVLRQSDRLPAYQSALARLAGMGLIYACTCSRRDIAAALDAPQEGVPRLGPDGQVYPGTCRSSASRPRSAADLDALPDTAALRLDMGAAVARLGTLPAFTELDAGPGGQTGRIDLDAAWRVSNCGDIVIARRGWGTSYHLAVVVDDAAQGVTHVTRGRDLFEATAIHVVLQALLELPTPVYRHHRLIRDAAGKRLAKRDDARAIRLYRDAGHTPAEVRAMVGL
ncbi:tRNA glutamyl-Q(34) synthetase GluQRS [Oceanomicrobium pacificus]|uniref:tRNA glutamyl-Q(34) synthetase GluQRS n=1 Tax=Oceanomicrobium pacificus TaxID=2692916 RepID=A0A6B0U4M7_9RHOB|nr:tRNA glutamyl-Q(34) synthetase GluQRS [Oceanomicrobium pacificus]MXU65891.1 tRNA glutamyl-Q(34) synthetase GluQRS [Oceanomicrobium pacificus]